MFRRQVTDVDATGQLLLCPGTASGMDGNPSLNTDGFFGFDDLPPCETWIGYIADDDTGDLRRGPERDQRDGAIRCWIPGDFISIAARGVASATLQCMRFADEADMAEVARRCRAFQPWGFTRTIRALCSRVGRLATPADL